MGTLLIVTMVMIILIQTDTGFTKVSYKHPFNANRSFPNQPKMRENYSKSVFINFPEKPSQAATCIKNKTFNILFVNMYAWLFFEKYPDTSIGNHCPCCNCKFITEEQSVATMDAVVFGAMGSVIDIQQYSLSSRPKDQIWVFFRMEPPPFFEFGWYRDDPIWRKTMNWSWGYRLDSDIFFPHATFNIRNKRLNRNYAGIFKRKSRDAAWVVSHCQTQSERRLYVKQLQMLGLSVDIYGFCSENKRRVPWSEIKSLIDNKYKFYLAFENSICTDYVSEKFFKYYKLDTVLLVRGGINYTKYFDKSTFINTADFASIKEVVEYLKMVGNNETLYTQFLREKDKYMPTERLDELYKSTCVLCQKLNNNSVHRNTKVYDDIGAYLHSNTCVAPKDIH